MSKSYYNHVLNMFSYRFLISVGADQRTDEELDAFVREKGDSAYHPSCTCKMGDPNDPMAVVGPDTKVLGKILSLSSAGLD
jgi:choline dehydrogenase-like flavoprotein